MVHALVRELEEVRDRANEKVGEDVRSAETRGGFLFSSTESAFRCCCCRVRTVATMWRV